MTNAAHSEVYQDVSKRFLLNVSEENGEVVKLHKSKKELKAGIEAFIKLVERTEGIQRN